MIELILSILLSIAIIMNYVIPPQIAYLAESVVSKLVLFGILLLFVIKKRFLLAILFFLFIIKLHMVSSMQSYIPSEFKKNIIMQSLNSFDHTPSLEQEIIHKMN